MVMDNKTFKGEALMIKGYTLICNECKEQVTIKSVDDIAAGNIKVQSTMQGDVFIYCDSCNANDTSTTIEI
jgi:uncharacterized protein YlaI